MADGLRGLRGFLQSVGMAEQDNTQSPSSDRFEEAPTQAIFEALMAACLTAGEFESLMLVWEQTLLYEDTDNLRHGLQLASAALALMSHADHARDDALELPFPRLTVSSEGIIQQVNEAGRALFGVVRGASVEALGVSGTAFQTLRDAPIKANRFVRAETEEDSGNRWLTFIRTDQGFAVESSELYWSDGFVDHIQSTFDVTIAELDILRKLAHGLSGPEIAELRGSSLATVRTQIRSIYSKLEARNQVDLVNIVVSLGNAYSKIDTAGKASPDDLLVRLHDGRKLAYRLYGSPAGKHTVVFLHDEYYGVALPSEISRLAQAEQVSVIAPIKPGFGASDPYPDSATAISQGAADVLQLLDRLDIGVFTLLTRRTGIRQGLEILHRHPERVQGFVAASPALPAKSTDEFDNVTHFARTIMNTIVKRPWSLQFITRAGLRYLKVAGPRRFAEFLNQGSELDLAVLQDPEVWPLVEEGLLLGSCQGEAPYLSEVLYDAEHTYDRLMSAPREIVCLVGEQDPHDRIGRTQRLIEQGAPLHLATVDQAGQLFFFDQPARVFEQLRHSFSKPV